MTALIYKVLPQIDWDTACNIGTYSGSADDLRDGFIHFSAAHQLPGTLKKYFCNQSGLLLVAFRASDFGPSLKYEASRGGDLFPHLYGPLPTGLALWQRRIELGTDGVPAVEKDWLEC